MRFFSAFFMTLFFLQGFAEAQNPGLAINPKSQTSSNVIKKLVGDFYDQHADLTTSLSEAPAFSGVVPPPRCVPNVSPKECVEAVCQQLVRFECDEPHELAEVTRACRNVDASCVRNICARVNRFDCDDRAEVVLVAESCRGVQDATCIDYVCSRLTRFDCDELHELMEVARQCR